MKNKKAIRGGWSLNIFQCWCIAAILLTVLTVAVIKYPGEEVNYLNSDATWHTLLTMKAYDETPVSEHYFLPIVSLGDERDKGIPWGATIPDKKGNYYYTSFSPMGYVLPYLFVKMLHLPFTEKSLYIFNCLLLMLSCFVIYSLLCELFRDRIIYKLIYAVLLAYILSPEIMHGIGMVYWHQSLMQVFLPLQILFYSKYILSGNKRYWHLTLTMCVINPYTEWTGYVANVGLFIAEAIRNRKNKGIVKALNAAFIMIFTMISFALFCGHYLLVTDARVFFNALKSRFFARNIATDVAWKLLFTGYWESFTAMIILAILFSIICIYKEGAVTRMFSMENKQIMLILFVSAFPLMENVIMKQHAVSYTYDRMKLSIPLVILLYWLMSEVVLTKQKIKMQLITLTVVSSIIFPFAMGYKEGSRYYWAIDYTEGNVMLSQYINDNYDDSVVGFDAAVRGYVNMTMRRGVYEWISDASQLESKADLQKVRYIVLLKKDDAAGKDAWNFFKLSAEIYDRKNQCVQTISNEGNSILISDWASLEIE